MKNITLKKEDIGKGELVLINPDYTLKSTINNLVSFDEEYNNIKLNNIANYSLHLILNNKISKSDIDITVDLPAPLEPIIVIKSPVLTSKLISLKANFSLTVPIEKVLLILSIFNIKPSFYPLNKEAL